jgi:glycosyltransferase involved in cell wall biosynthesis
MENSPFFSITIPAYNRAYILPETIESIQKQTFENWEVIVVDDGSKDDTEEVVKAIGTSDSRVRYVYQNNAERSAARNNGASHAKGLYLLFLDSDDSFFPEHLQKIYDLLKSNSFPVGMVFSNVTYLTDEGLIQPDLPVMQSGREFEYVLLQPITPSRVCIYKDIFSEFKFDPEIVIVEDMVLWVSIASKYPVFQLLDYTSIYRIHGGNSVDLSRNSYLLRYKGLLRLFNHEKYQSISAKIPHKIKKHLLAECSFNMARHFEFIMKFGKMNQMLLLSFWHLLGYRNKERIYMFLSHFPFTAKLFRKAAENGKENATIQNSKS